MNPDPDEIVHPGQEELNWGEGIKEQNRANCCNCCKSSAAAADPAVDNEPRSSYWAISEQARKMIPGEKQCKIFCGGKTCKYCTELNWKPHQMAVSGLYSEWVTDNILAMARLSNHNIEKYDMLKQLRDLNVKTIVNLQQQGEHAYCGFGNDDSGFSYNPQKLMDSGFFFYNFAMEDYGVTSMAKMLDIVKVMQFAVSLGKIAVHCHAGLGRTGLIIACYLIYTNRVSAKKAVLYVRSRRPGSIQTSLQVKTCFRFEEFIKVYFVIFSSKVPGALPVTFNRFLMRQKELLHGYEARKLKYVPKVIYVCCERLLELCGKGVALYSLRQQLLEPMPPELLACKESTSNQDLSQLSSSLTESLTGIESDKLSFTRQSPSINNPSLASDDDYTFDLEEEMKKSDSDKSLECLLEGDPVEESVTRTEKLAVKRFTPQALCEIIVGADCSEATQNRINYIEVELNKTDGAWVVLAKEDNPHVICGVMCEWIDQLHEPILRQQDVKVLVDKADEIIQSKALLHLEKSTRYFLEYIVLFLSKFDPIEMETLDQILEFFLSMLCQKRLNLTPAPVRQNNIDSLKPADAQHLCNLFKALLIERKVASRKH